MLNYLGMPIQASTHAAEIDHMTVLVHWLMLLLFVGWGAFFVFVLVRFRKEREPRWPAMPERRARFRRASKSASRSSRSSCSLFYAIPAWATRVRDFPADSEAVVVRVTGEQFAWNVHYPGNDGRFGRRDIKLVGTDNPIGLDRTDADAKDDITTMNQLNFPVDRPVLVHLSSKDVIHSFGLFEMRVKQDAIPGMDIPVWFIPNRIGDYEISCSQLCGLGHYRMRGFVSVKTDADFKNWLAEEAKTLKP